VLDVYAVIDVDIRRDEIDITLIARSDSGILGELRGTTTTTNARGLCGRGRWRGSGGWCRGSGPAPTTRRRSGLLFGTDALFPLPARADTRDLVVGEQSEMAAHGNVHLAKNRDDFVAGDPELACHVMYAKLAQTILLADSNRVRSFPLSGGRLDEGANAPRELWIDDANRRRRFPSYRGAQIGGRGHFNHTNAFRAEHRNDFVEAVLRRVHSDHRELQFPALRGVAYHLNADDD
jgi:hypothetical protein